jgi:hypothetical protein
MVINLLVLRRCAAAVVLAMTAVGCSGDAAMAPAPDRPDVATQLATQQGISLQGFQNGTDTLMGKWRIPVSQASVQRLGYHMVTFPAYAICNPETSSYGVAHWDEPCEASRNPVNLTVRAWMDDNHELQLSFKPDIRFVPSNDPTRWVMLYMKDRQVTAATPVNGVNILWLPKVNGPPVDEAASDPTLATQASPVSGYAWRRIKHFSGYTVAAGRSAPADGNLQDGTSASSGY